MQAFNTTQTMTFQKDQHYLDFGGPPRLCERSDEALVDATGDAAEPADGQDGEDDAGEDQVQAGHALVDLCDQAIQDCTM